MTRDFATISLIKSYRIYDETSSCYFEVLIFAQWKTRCSKFAERKIATQCVGKLRRAYNRRSIILSVRRDSLAPLGNIFSPTSLSMPTSPLHLLPPNRRTVDNPEFYGEMRKAPRLGTLGGASQALSDIFKKFHPPRCHHHRSSVAHHFFAVASGWHYANQCSSDLPVFRVGLVDLRALFALFFTFSLSRRSPLVNAYGARSCTSRDETPSTCQNVTNPPLPREHGREWGLPKRNEISSFSAWVIVLETDSGR